MLSLRRCRELLGDNCQLSDSEIEMVREQLYALAQVVLGASQGRPTQAGLGSQKAEVTPCEQITRRNRKHGSFSSVLAAISPEERYEIEQRSAIMELEGSLDRTEAERRALLEWVRNKPGGNSGGRIN